MRCVRRVRCVFGAVRAVRCVCAVRCERADGAADIIAMLLLLLLRAVHVPALRLPCALRADTEGACARLRGLPLTVPALLHAAFVSYQLNRLSSIFQVREIFDFSAKKKKRKPERRTYHASIVRARITLKPKI